MAPSSTAAAVADAVRRLFANAQFRAKDVAASLSGNSVIVKKITLPAMTEQELAESIYWEAEQYIPFDIQDVNLDYEVLAANGDSHGTMDVLLVAAKKDKIGDYTSVITQAGRTPVVVDVDAFALQNAYEANYGFEPGGIVALLNAGASATNINILHGAQSVFTRDVSMGGNAFTEAVQRELGLPYELAEQLKKGHDVDGATYEDARPVLKAMTDNVLLEVEKTFDFFKATASNDRIDRIVLSGGAIARRRLRRGARGTVRNRSDALRSVPPGVDRPGQAGGHLGGGDGTGRGRGRRPGPAEGRRPMIRINLLAAERRRAQSAPKGLLLAQKMTVIGSLILVLAALGLGWRYWALGQTAATTERRLNEARREEQRLAGILKQVAEFDARREQLQQRATLIDELRRGQSAPVHMIDQISRALPEMTWLTEMRQEGFDVTIQGRCLSLTSLSDFVGNLEASRYFKRPVEILSSEVVTGQQGAPDTIQFSIRGSFQMAGIDQIVPPQPTGRGKRPAKGGPRG